MTHSVTQMKPSKLEGTLRTSKYDQLLEYAHINQPQIGLLGYRMRTLLASNVYHVAAMAALFIALFGGSVVQFLDLPDDPVNMIVDIMMCVLMVFFFLEITAFWIAGGGYACSFFFFTDLLGSLSMIFEISFLLGVAGKEQETNSKMSPVLIRSARAARVGARAARLTRLAKCFNFITRARSGGEQKEGKEAYDAKVLKAKLAATLSTKVAMLTLVVVMGMPVFEIGHYPEEDFSMRAWVRTLERDYGEAFRRLSENSQLTTVNIFNKTVEEMKSFYSSLDYTPYRLAGYSKTIDVHGRQVLIPGEGLISGTEPVRKQNILVYHVKKCEVPRPHCNGSDLAAVYFNFRLANQWGAVKDCCVILFVVLAMIMETFDLNLTIDNMVVRPVEGMLGTVQMMAKILSTVTTVPGASDDMLNEEISLSEETHEDASENQILDRVFAKLAVLTSAFMHQGIADAEEMKAMDDESRGILVEMMMLQGNTAGDAQFWAAQSLLASTGKCALNLPVDEATIDSWDLNLLSMSIQNVGKVVLHIFFDSPAIGDLTGRAWIDVGTFQKFHDSVRSGYLDNPYHNYLHASDVTASVFRLFTRLRCQAWMKDFEMYALLIAALAHDIAHPGKTTQFLVETRHELALRYNDTSPLESMHCATLFEICRDHTKDIFGKFQTDMYKKARKVCISAIINTDNALHFEMVQKISQVYASTQAICDAQAETPQDFSDKYREEVLEKNTVLWQQLLLHFADVSNPLKPWEIGKAFATRVQDEFFKQGDEEKRIGIPVGMLNDREKVSRSGTEHGFINFLVAPLTFAAVGNFPPLHHLAVQMATNLQEWKDLWVKDVNPSPEDIAKRDADIQKVNDTVEKLRDRRATEKGKTPSTTPRDAVGSRTPSAR